MPKKPTYVELEQTESEFKTAGKALHESEEKYRNILNSIEDGYYEVDLAGNLTFFNDSLCKIYGIVRDELMGMHNREYMSPETAKKTYEIFNSVYKSGEPTKIFDWEFIKNDGTKIDIEISVSLIKNSEREAIGFRGIVRDIGERKRVEEALLESEEKYRLLFEESLDAIAITTPEGRFVNYNRKVLDMLCCSDDQIKQIIFSDLYKDRQSLKDFIGEIKNKGFVDGFETQLVTGDKRIIDVLLKASVIRDEAGNIRYLHGILRDVTEEKAKERMIKRLTLIDERTQLSNVRHFEKILPYEMGSSGRYNHPLTLMMLDIDYFKKYNDTYGHPAGDDILFLVGGIITECLRETDTAFRYGGEEFAVLMPETGIDPAFDVAQRLRRCFKAQTKETISIGITEYRHPETSEQFVKRADEALYFSKENGRDQVNKK